MTSPTIGHYNEIAVWLRLALFTNANRVHLHLEAFSNPYQKHFTVNCVVHIHIHIKSTLQLCGPYPYQKHFTTVWFISISTSKALYNCVVHIHIHIKSTLQLRGPYPIHIKSTLQLCGPYPYPYQRHFTVWSLMQSLHIIALKPGRSLLDSVHIGASQNCLSKFILSKSCQKMQ